MSISKQTKQTQNIVEEKKSPCIEVEVVNVAVWKPSFDWEWKTVKLLHTKAMIYFKDK